MNIMTDQKMINQYLERFSDRCFSCGKDVSRDKMTMVSNTVRIGVPDAGDIKHYYMVCDVCLEDKVVI